MRRMCVSLFTALLLIIMTAIPSLASAEAIATTSNKQPLFDRMLADLFNSDYENARETWTGLKEYRDSSSIGSDVIYDWSGWEYVRDFLDAWDKLEHAQSSTDPIVARDAYEAVYEAMLELKYRPLKGDSKMPDKCGQLCLYAQARMFELAGSPIEALVSYTQIDRIKMVDDTLLQKDADSSELKWQEYWQSVITGILACQKAVYSQGITHFEQGSYEKAKEQFTAVTDYKDSRAWVKKCDDAIAIRTTPVPVDHVISNLQFIQVTGTSLSVRWDSTMSGYSYEVTYAPQYVSKNVMKTIASSTQVELTGLIPSTRYALTIKALDSKAAPLMGERETLNVGPFTDYGIKWPTIAIYSYKKVDASAFSIKHVVDTNKIIQLNDTQLPLPRFRIADDTSGCGYVILVSFMCEKTQSDKEFPCRFVLRIRDGGTFEREISETIAGQSTYISLFSTIDELLDAYYEENNGWKEAAGSLDFYVRDQLLASCAFILKQ